MGKTKLCLNCDYILEPAGGFIDEYTITGVCDNCGIYYEDDEPIAIQIGDRIRLLQDANTDTNTTTN